MKAGRPILIAAVTGLVVAALIAVLLGLLRWFSLP